MNLANRLSKRVVIEQREEESDGIGGISVAWSEFKTLWAEIIPRRANEEYFAGAIANTVTHKITIRHIDGIKPSMRVVHNQRIFKIISIINPQESNKTLEFLAEEVLK